MIVARGRPPRTAATVPNHVFQQHVPRPDGFVVASPTLMKQGFSQQRRLHHENVLARCERVMENNHPGGVIDPTERQHRPRDVPHDDD